MKTNRGEHVGIIADQLCLTAHRCPGCNTPTSGLVCHFCGKDMSEPHSFDDCQLLGVPVGGFYIAGLGETVERDWHCPVCKRKWREVYLYSCSLDDETDEML